MNCKHLKSDKSDKREEKPEEHIKSDFALADVHFFCTLFRDVWGVIIVESGLQGGM